MRKSFVLIVAVLAVAGGVMLYRHTRDGIARERQEQEQVVRAEAEVHALIDRLKIAPEAIHLDIQAIRPITTLRKESFEKLGVTTVQPYANQIRPGTIGWSGNARNYDWNLSLESFWINDAYGACSEVAHILRDPRAGAAHEYLKAQTARATRRACRACDRDHIHRQQARLGQRGRHAAGMGLAQDRPMAPRARRAALNGSALYVGSLGRDARQGGSSPLILDVVAAG